MILPIHTYGNAVLRKVAEPIDEDYPRLQELIDNMFETMHRADGVGLAAPQVGLPIRLFVVDLAALKEDNPELADFRLALINPEMLDMSEASLQGEEGCLSIPGIHENVERSKSIQIKYLDSNFVEHVDVFEDFKARVIQHEYDHLEGHLFTDKVSPIRRQFIKSKLNNIVKGKTGTSYKTVKASK
ncbi:MAG: peptide deformylase [Porphyromonadaceae bacterium CG2_30_38_12]|nr:MAG: peptide deformylase [Porphyromonadaceae bacterium CG2_30_38_12]